MADMLRTLQAAGIAPARAQEWAEPMAAAAALHDITTPQRLAAWVAQCAHESARMTAVEERLVYTSAARIAAVWPRLAPIAAELVRAPQALANAAYAGRNGNGPRASGDGWSYRGRGLLQLTGRRNYAAAGAALGLPLEAQPDLAATPSGAAMTAAWYWLAHDCSRLADRGDIDGITRVINGPAMAGAAERARLYAETLRALG